MADRAKVAQAIMSNYTPSWREKIGNSIYDVARALMPSTANRMREEATMAVDFIPGVGEAVGLNDAYNDFNAGNYGLAAAGLGATAAGVVPGVGDAAAATLRKFLPSSSSLNVPRAPTMDELASIARMEDVPTEMLRGSQGRMDWEGHREGRYGEPMFGDYSKFPVVSRRKDGEYIVYDGHHRSVDALNNGLPSIRAWVVDASDYDPSNAGRAPSGMSISDDDLLRELGL